MKKLLFVFNPHAGKGLIRNNLCDILNILTAGGYEVTAYPTQAPMDGYEKILSDAKNYDVIACSGGDGTLSEAVKALMQQDRKIPLGYIPAGSTNDFAASMSIPKQMTMAAQAIVDGVTFDYDVGEFNGEYYVYVAGFGAFTDVSYETSQSVKNVLGHMAYIIEGIKRLPKYTGYRMTVEHDGEVIEGSFILGLISNSTSIGGMKALVRKGVYFDDGLFEVTLVRTPTGALSLQSTLSGAATGKLNDKDFVTFKTNRVKFSSVADIPWTMDGEAGGSHHEVEIINHKQAVRFIVLPDDKTAEQQLIKSLDPEYEDEPDAAADEENGEAEE